MQHADAPTCLTRHRLLPQGKAYLAAASCLLVVSCSLVPDYHRPDAGVPVAWNSALGDHPHQVPAQGAWWTSFGSPELDNLMQQSLARNFNLQAAVARIAEAQGSAEVSAAPLFASVSVAGTHLQQNGTKNTQTHQLLAQASYELDFWGKNHAAAASGDALAHASAFDADTVVMTLSASVAATYFQILSLNERIGLARRIAEDARHVLVLILVQQDAGTATDLQVQQQRAAVATFEAVVPALQQQMDQATHALAVLIGRAPEGFRVAAVDLRGLARPDVVPDLPAALLEQRPDIRAAEARLISANFDIGVARAAFFPSISLTAVAGIGARQLTTLSPPAAVTGLGVSLLQPLFLGGQLKGQLRFDRARRAEMLATYQQTVIAAFQDVEDALSTLNHVRDLEAIETTAVTAASKAADLAKMQYRLGTADYLTVLTTEQALYQAEDALLQIRLQRLQAIVSLFRALGGGFDAPAGPVVTQAGLPSTPAPDRSLGG